MEIINNRLLITSNTVLKLILEKKYYLFLKYSLIFKQLLPKYIKKIYFYIYDFYILIKSKYLINLLKFLKYDTQFQFKTLVDICVVDYVLSNLRFKLIYSLLSIHYNMRLNLFFFLQELSGIKSIIILYENANWLEREIWDMFGIFFFNHIDLRRILTDYGFKGFPLRKDFPLTGFREIYFNENKKRLIYKKLILAQEYRLYTFRNPWNFLNS
jgi:NADH dehydrogenase (ubiquinone) Fe-S protein 3